MTPHRVADVLFTAAALLLLAFVVDVPRILIDIFNIPGPRLGGNPPYLILPAAVLAGAYLHLRNVRTVRDALETPDLLFLSALVVWSAAEVFHWTLGKVPDFRLISEALWWFLAYYVVRQHILVTRAPGEFVSIALAFVVAVGLIHLAALGLVRAGMVTDAHAVAEIVQRNGISLMLVCGVYLCWFVLPDLRPRVPWHAAAIVALAFVHAIANQARAALVALLVLVAFRFAANLGALRGPVVAALSVALGLGILAVSTAYPMLREYGWISSAEAVTWDAGAVDPVRSMIYRLAANSQIVELLVTNPVVGVGASDVMQARSGGYGSHTYYLLVLAAYGLVGFFAFGIAVASLLFMRRDARALNAFVLAMLLVTILSFVNDLYAWLAMAVAIAASDRDRALGYHPRRPEMIVA